MTICQSHRFFRKYVDDFKRFVPPLGDEWGEAIIKSIII
jgi:hypothetical protein